MQESKTRVISGYSMLAAAIVFFALVSNLLVVLCSESAAAPVINTGTLYQ